MNRKWIIKLYNTLKTTSACWNLKDMLLDTYIDRTISTPWYTYCIWNSYTKNHHWQLTWWWKRSLMQDCSETLVWPSLIDISMIVENVMKLGIAEKFDIYIYIYIYIFVIYIYIYTYKRSNLLIFRLNNVYYTIV